MYRSGLHRGVGVGVTGARGDDKGADLETGVATAHGPVFLPYKANFQFIWPNLVWTVATLNSGGGGISIDSIISDYVYVCTKKNEVLIKVPSERIKVIYHNLLAMPPAQVFTLQKPWHLLYDLPQPLQGLLMHLWACVQAKKHWKVPKS